MSTSEKETLDAIERTQASLRDSIEQVKEFAAKSDSLIKKHRKKIENG